MAINLKSTSASGTNKVNLLVYGASGAGKTTLIPSLPSPVILSAESGLLSISGSDIPYLEITDLASLGEAYQWLTESEESKQFESVAIDSISEIAEVVLSHEKRIAKDPRQAYGAMQDQIAGLIRTFRDLPEKNVYMTAKLEKQQDEMGRVLYSPSMPGNKTGQQLPYFFDEVFALRVEKDEANTYRALLTDSDGIWQAKDRSGKLNAWEEPNLGAIIKKIRGGQ
jgi:phage nucleotide-binding protein